MKYKLPSLLPVLMIISLLLSGTSLAAKGSWELWVGANEYTVGSAFTIEKDYPIIKMRVKAFEGGPVSVFILDEYSLSDWENNEVVIAYAGGQNMSSGTIKGQLGLSRDNQTGSQLNYYVIVDNRGNDYYSNVRVDVIITVTAAPVFFVLLVLIPLAIVYRKK